MTDYKNYDEEHNIDKEMWEEICRELDPISFRHMRDSGKLRDWVIKMSKQQYECCLCKCERYGYGNNPQPVMEGKCCNSCNNNVVIPARINTHMKNKSKK